MNPTIVASIVAFVSAVGTAIIASILTKRRLDFELRSAHRADMARRQAEACEAIWSVLEPTSFAEGDGRVVKNARTEPKIDRETALSLSNEITRVFYSKHGLYLSRDVREALFELRHFVRDEFLASADHEPLDISKNLAKKFRGKATKLRIALRAELGVTDLNAARDLSASE